MALTQRERSQKSYSNRKNNGLCPVCGKKLDREGHYCSDCLIKNREYRRQNIIFYRENGLCTCCGKEKVFGSEKQCISCLEKQRERRKPLTEEQRIRQNEHFKKQQKGLYEERAEQGICTKCGKRKADYGKKKCKICLEKDAFMHRKQRFDQPNIRDYRRENKLCYYCGEPAEENKNVCAKCSEERRKDRMKAKVNNSYWKSDNRVIFKN